MEQRWNRLADRMSYFHNLLEVKFNTIYMFSDGSFANVMSLQGYLRTIVDFQQHLQTHHDIEETYIFPILAQRMPAFAKNERHKNAHKTIHKGLDRLEDLLSSWKEDPSIFSPEVLRACLDELKRPLFTHLEEEVRDLSAENMKKYYKLEEVDQLPM